MTNPERIGIEPRKDRLLVARVEATEAGAFVELSETVDDPDGAPLRTDEGIVFDVAHGVITRVAVYLQTSYHA